jgi:beta-lactamase superfamily II metal-dependent hydrolase
VRTAATSAGKTRPEPDEAVLGAAAVLTGEPFLNIEMLPAGHGDCLWVEYGSGATRSRVLIDCGTAGTFDAVLKARIEKQKASDRDFELFILSHIDDDHIGGAIPMLQAAKGLGVSFADVWFNGWKHLRAGLLGAKQGEVFSALIQKNGLPWNAWRGGLAIVLPGDELPTCTLPGGMVLTLLSPTTDKLKNLAEQWEQAIEELHLTPGKAEDFGLLARNVSTSKDVKALADAPFSSDVAVNNGSSIAVLVEYQGKSALLGADAHAPLLVASINKLLKQRGAKKLKLDAFKLPHHGSQNNLNIELLQLLDCRNYLLSSNGSRFNHPDREAIGRVIRYGGDNPRLHFNYESSLNAVWKEAALQRDFKYEAVYPQAKEQGLVVRL